MYQQLFFSIISYDYPVCSYLFSTWVFSPSLTKLNNMQIESRRKQLTRRSILKKRLSDINTYRKTHTNLDEALLSITEEKDSVSFPEERVLIIKPVCQYVSIINSHWFQIIAYASQYLLEGANIECRDAYGNTPLHKAAWMGYPDLTKELVQRGANVHAMNSDGETPMEVAIRKGLELGDERTGDYSRVAAVVIKEMEPVK